MKLWKWLILLAIVAVGVAGIRIYSHYKLVYPSTENAYLDADTVRISSQVSGPVVRVPVGSQQAVEREQLLLEIDDANYRADVEAARAQLALAHRQVAENRAELANAEAELVDAKVLLKNAKDQLKRLAELKKKSYSSEQQTEDAQAAYDSALARLEATKARLAKARARLQSDDSGRDLLVADAEARLRNAEWSLAHTTLRAPCAGVLESVDVSEGETLAAHSTAMRLVCTDDFWIDANFKETQLARIRPGQSVEIHIDMYPGQTFQGEVQSISPASGTAFSLLPPQNATGNWVKTTQRIPVRIRVVDPPAQYPLRVGASTEVQIDTHNVKGGS